MKNSDERQAILSAARHANSMEIERRVRHVVDAMIAQGRTPSFYAVADAAHVARSTLYRRDDLKSLVVEARQAALEPTNFSNGFIQNAGLKPSHESDAQHLNEIARLKRENEALHEALVCAQRECNALAAQLVTKNNSAEQSRFSYYVCSIGEAA